MLYVYKYSSINERFIRWHSVGDRLEAVIYLLNHDLEIDCLESLGNKINSGDEIKTPFHIFKFSKF